MEILPGLQMNGEELIEACRIGNVEDARKALKEGASLDYQDYDGSTALMAAAANNKLSCLKLLVELKASLEIQDEDGNTPLMRAVSENSVDCCRYLLEHRAAINIKNKKQCTPLILAAISNSGECCRLLVDYRANLEAHNKNGDTALIRAAIHNQPQICELLINLKANVEAKNKYGNTAIIEAAIKNKSECCRVLAEMKANLEIEYQDGLTTLIKAAGNNSVDCCRLLIENKANIEAKAKTGETALIRAAINGQLAACKLLLDSKANTETRNKAGNTAFIEAAIKNKQDCCQALVEARATVDLRYPPDNSTALMKALKSNNLDLCRLLLHFRASLEATDKNGSTALILAAFQNNLNICRLLLDAKANFYAKNNYGQSALDVASNESINFLRDYEKRLEGSRSKRGMEIPVKMLNVSSEPLHHKTLNGELVMVSHRGVLTTDRNPRNVMVAKYRIRGNVEEKLVHLPKIYSIVKHPNLINLQGYCLPDKDNKKKDSPSELWFVADYVESKRLDVLFADNDRVHRPLLLNPACLRWICCEIITGLFHLHQNGFAHGNLSTQNIFVDKQGRVYLTEIELAAPGEASGGASSSGDRKSLFHQDVYQLGCVLSELLLGRVLKEEDRKSPAHVMSLIAPLQVLCPEELLHNLPRMLLPEPEKRPTIGQLASDFRPIYQASPLISIMNPPKGK